jgi:CBS domain containing-hemolysin-like protein
VGQPLLQEGITTVSGFVTHRLGGFPRKGDVIPVGGYDLTVEEIDGMRVSRLKLTRTTKSAPGKSG